MQGGGAGGDHYLNGDIDDASTIDGGDDDDVEQIVPPNGDYGWVIVAASLLCIAASFGQFQAFGVFEREYHQNVFPSETSAKISLIGTLQIAFQSIPSAFTGYAAEAYGYRRCIFIGGVLIGLGLILASFATQIWLSLLAQGAIVGVGAAFVVVPAISIPAQYFTTKRGLATGLVYSGTGIGGVIISRGVQSLISGVGIFWALRIVGIVCMTLICVASMFMQPLIQPKPREKILDFGMFRNRRFFIMVIYGMLMFSVFYVPFYYIPLFVVSTGSGSADTGATVDMIANVGSIVGRVIGAFMADRLGCMNTIVLSLMVSVTSVFGIWLPFSTLASTTTFGIIYGLSSGAQMAMLTQMVAIGFGLDRLATLVGVVLCAGGVGIVAGTPLAGVIYDHTHMSSGFLGLIGYNGSVLALTLIMAIALRCQFTKKIFTRA
ncbi:MFS general substrate transporter [Ramicandelaber brevisporus]|nr:MFS general substrate transporter [Ramicandelaber brevisporus]